MHWAPRRIRRFRKLRPSRRKKNAKNGASSIEGSQTAAPRSASLSCVMHKGIAELGRLPAHFRVEADPFQEGELRLQRHERPVDEHASAFQVTVKRLLPRDRLGDEPGQQRDHRCRPQTA